MIISFTDAPVQFLGLLFWREVPIDAFTYCEVKRIRLFFLRNGSSLKKTVKSYEIKNYDSDFFVPTFDFF